MTASFRTPLSETREPFALRLLPECGVRREQLSAPVARDLASRSVCGGIIYLHPVWMFEQPLQKRCGRRDNSLEHLPETLMVINGCFAQDESTEPWRHDDLY